MDRLDASSREWAIGNAIHSAAYDPEKVESLIALLNTEADRALALASLEKYKSDREEASLNTPAEILDYLIADRHKEPEGHIAVLMKLAQRSPEMIAAINAQFQAMPDERKRKVAEMVAGYAGEDDVEPVLAGEAVRYLVANPEGSRIDPANLSSTYAVRLAVDNPSAAVEWIGTLPEGDAKLWARKNLAVNWAKYDPKATDQWLATLSSGTRTEVRNFMKKEK